MQMLLHHIIEQVKNRQNIKSIVSASEVILGSRKDPKVKDKWVKIEHQG